MPETKNEKSVIILMKKNRRNCLTHCDQHFYGIAKADAAVRKAFYIQH